MIMKKEVIKILKENGKESLFTEDRWCIMKELVIIAMKKDQFLKNYLSLDPLLKAQWMADHLILLAEQSKI